MEVRQVLEDAGWYPERKIEIDYMVEEYIKNGLNPPDHNLQKLMEEYCNIRLYFTMPDGQENDIRLNTDIISSVDNNGLQKFNEILEDTLVPIGSIYDDTALLMGSYSGKFYMLSNKMFFILGSNFYDSLDTIINQRDLYRVN